MARMRSVVMLAALASWTWVFQVDALSEPLPVQWTTGYSHPLTCGINDICGPQGPDGPWQALRLGAGAGAPNNSDKEVALYPSLNTLTTVARGRWYDPGTAYDPSKSSSANRINVDHLVFLNGDGNMKNLTLYNDIFGIASSSGLSSSTVNLTFADGSMLDTGLPNGSTYTPKVGSFGLGYFDPIPYQGSGTLEQLSSRNLIGSQFFSLHMGSAALDLAGSLVLGGYEKNRALGNVSVFPSQDVSLFLIDMMLGVEEGGSPFDRAIGVSKQEPKTIWQALTADMPGANTTRLRRGPEGAAVMTIDPSKPYFHLPNGNCDAIGKLIPVTWRQDIKYYVWNVDDPQYHRLISSPAYLSLVFADPDAKNITIKIPFALLNLTLEPPIVSTPTPYFPCQSTDNSVHIHGIEPNMLKHVLDGTWTLGRAFLQAAFFGFGLTSAPGTIVWYLAQAPGPSLGPSVMQTYSAGDASIHSNPADSFAKTWRSHWKTLPEDNFEDKGIEKTSDGGGLSGGVIVGIVVGTLLVVTALGAAFFGWKHWAKWLKNRNLYSHGTMVHEVSGAGVHHEMPVPRPRYEIQGCMPPVELPVEKPVRSPTSG